MALSRTNTIALVEWSHLLEDFLDNIHVTFEEFTEEMTGGWLFGYVEALKLYDVKTVVFCFSSKVKITERRVHKPTGATICIIPSTRLYRHIRRTILNPYAATIAEAAGDLGGIKRLYYSLLLKFVGYASTSVIRLYSEIRRQNCSAILCQDYEHPRFDICVLIGRLMGIPVFGSFQGGNWQMSSVERFIRPHTIKAAKGLIIASGIEIERVRNKYKVPAKRVSHIFNPIDLSMWTGSHWKSIRAELNIDAQASVVIWHGRIDFYRKGLDLLLEAWENITINQPAKDYHLILVGTGNNADLLEQQLKLRKLKGIHWINNYINDRAMICAYLKSADIYVLPSRHEGFAVAPLEAMACALPLVAFNAPGVEEMLKHGESSGGILLQERNSNALAKALTRLLENKLLCKELGKLAEQNMQEHFSLSAIGIQLKKLMIQ
jgi:glycosyltransferase involved in cell wall biosynthesis